MHTEAAVLDHDRIIYIGRMEITAMASVEGKCMKANKKAFFKRIFTVYL